MQKLCSKLHFFIGRSPHSPRLGQPGILYSSPARQPHCTRASTATPSTSRLISYVSPPSLHRYASRSPFLPQSLVQVRHLTMKQRKRLKAKKAREWKPMTPKFSKLKKTKMKPLSSYKKRFRLLKNGTILRWQAGLRHYRTKMKKKVRLKLKKPVAVHPTWAKKLKRSGFRG